MRPQQVAAPGRTDQVSVADYLRGQAAHARRGHGGSRPTSPSCRSYYAERDLAPSDVRGCINTLMNLIAVTAKMAKTKRSPYSR